VPLIATIIPIVSHRSLAVLETSDIPFAPEVLQKFKRQKDPSELRRKVLS
jgi:hypothetical protein